MFCSRVVPLIPQREEETQVAVASVVRAPPRPSSMSGAPHSQLLMRAVADAHKSLLSVSYSFYRHTADSSVVTLSSFSYMMLATERLVTTEHPASEL